MAMQGMDVDQAEATAKQITTLKGTIETTINSLNTQVTGLSQIWKGADATKFVGTTWPTHKSALTRCKMDLEALIAALRKDIADQRATSSS